MAKDGGSHGHRRTSGTASGTPSVPWPSACSSSAWTGRCSASRCPRWPPTWTPPPASCSGHHRVHPGAGRGAAAGRDARRPLRPQADAAGALALFGARLARRARSRARPGSWSRRRAVLGLGAAILMPLSMAVLTVLFPARERPRALACGSPRTSLGMPLGPIVGGWLLDHSVGLGLPHQRAGGPARAAGGRDPGAGVAQPAAARGRPRSASLPPARAGRPRLRHHRGRRARLGRPASRCSASPAASRHWRRSWPGSAARAHPLVDLALFRSRGFPWGALLATSSTSPCSASCSRAAVLPGGARRRRARHRPAAAAADRRPARRRAARRPLAPRLGPRTGRAGFALLAGGLLAARPRRPTAATATRRSGSPSSASARLALPRRWTPAIGALCPSAPGSARPADDGAPGRRRARRRRPRHRAQRRLPRPARGAARRPAAATASPPASRRRGRLRPAALLDSVQAAFLARHGRDARGCAAASRRRRRPGAAVPPRGAAAAARSPARRIGA